MARDYREAHRLMEPDTDDPELRRWIEATGRRTSSTTRWADTMPSRPGGLEDVPARPRRRQSRAALRDLLIVLAVLIVAAIAARWAQ